MQAAFGAQFQGVQSIPGHTEQMSDGSAAAAPVRFTVPTLGHLGTPAGPFASMVPVGWENPSHNIHLLTPFVPAGDASTGRMAHASDTFLRLFKESKWTQAHQVLRRAWDALTAPVDETTGVSRDRGRLSPEQARDLAELNALSSLLGQAFVLGAFHHFAEHIQNHSAWGRAMLTCKAYSLARIEDVVDGYAAHFGRREERAEAIQAMLVRLSWLAPSWVRSGTDEPHAQEVCLTRAFDRLSEQLLGAVRRLASPEETNAFLDDVASALQPAYRSPLLLLWVTRMPAIIEMGVHREFAIGDIGRQQGLGLFPQTVNEARAAYWREIFVSTAKTRLTGTRDVSQRLGSMQPLGRPQPMAPVAQSTTTTTHAQITSPDPEQFARDWVESVLADPMGQDPS